MNKGLRISVMLPAILAVLLACLLGQGGADMLSFRSLVSQSQSAAAAKERYYDLGEGLLLARLNVFQFLGTSSPQEMESKQKEFEAQVQQLRGLLQREDSLRKYLGKFEENLEEYKQIFALHSDFQTKKAYERIYAASQKKHEELLTSVRDATLRLETSQKDVAAAETQKAYLLSAGVFAIGLLLTLWGFVIVGRNVVSPLKHIRDTLERISTTGDLTLRVDVNSENEFGKVAQAFNQMLNRLERKADEASQIAAGKLNVKVEVASPQDSLGKAFADMIKSLSLLIQQTHQASSEVRGHAASVSQASFEHIGTSLTLAKETQLDFSGIVEEVSALHNNFEEVLHSSQEVVRHLEEVSRIFAQTGIVMRETFLSTQKMSSTSEELVAQSETLEHSLSQFRT